MKQRITASQIAQLNAQIEQLTLRRQELLDSPEFQKEREFAERVKGLMADYGYGLDELNDFVRALPDTPVASAQKDDEKQPAAARKRGDTTTAAEAGRNTKRSTRKAADQPVSSPQNPKARAKAQPVRKPRAANPAEQAKVASEEGGAVSASEPTDEQDISSPLEDTAPQEKTAAQPEAVAIAESAENEQADKGSVSAATAESETNPPARPVKRTRTRASNKTGQAADAKKTKASRALVKYRNPHTGEEREVTTARARELKPWRDEYGSDVVDLWRV
ncbi:hypothetical protein ACI2KR_27875 [Pseudomonas luteola]